MPKIEQKGRINPKAKASEETQELEVIGEVGATQECEVLSEDEVEELETPVRIIPGKKEKKVVELSVVEDNPGYYYHELRAPVSYDGVEFQEIHFDFESMSGQDLLLVEEELARKNKISIGVELSKANQYLLAVRAANKMKKENGFTMTSDLLEQLPLGDFNDICNATRRFFTQSG